jgi:phage tail sheath protein FI
VPVQPTYPGVYIEEVPSPVHTIVGVSTSVTAFLGYTNRGPVNRATQIFNYGDFQRTFGDLDERSPVAYAVQQFFQNGGLEAWIVRAAAGALAASVTVENRNGGSPVLKFSASSEGTWGNTIKVDVDYGAGNSLDQFNVHVTELVPSNGTLVPGKTEDFLNLTMESGAANYVEDVIAASSTLVVADRDPAALALVGGQAGTSTSGPLMLADLANIGTTQTRLLITVDDDGPHELALAAPTMTSLTAALTSLGADIVAKAAAAGVALGPAAQSGPAAGPKQITFTSANPGEHSSVRFVSAGTNDAAAALKLGIANGGIEAAAAGLMRPASTGTLGTPLDAALPAGGLGGLAAPSKVAITINRGADVINVGAGVNEQQTLTFSAAPTGGTFTLSFAGQTSAPIPFNANNAAVQTALEAIPGIGAGNVTVTPAAAPWTVTFVNALGSRDVPQLVADTSLLTPAGTTIAVATTVPGQGVIQLWATAADRPTSKEGLRSALEDALRNAAPASQSARSELANARVLLYSDRLQVILGGDPDAWATFANAGADTTASSIGLTAAAVEANVSRYSLGTGAIVRSQSAIVLGNDGSPPGKPELLGSQAGKKGFWALQDVDIFNLMCIPGVSDPDVLSAAMSYCEQRRAFLIVDVPSSVDTLIEAQAWIKNVATPKSTNAAAYFPWVTLPDPLLQYRARPFPPSGMMAGLYARTDGTRGVWKAPAGTEAVLRGPTSVTYKLSDPENGTLNPLALNAIRSLPVFGIVSWGARTLVGSDLAASEWKYVPVRRLALFIEESLFRGTQWVVFEPNDEPLWAQIRLNVGAFMQNLFRQGAFEGASPRDAYLVKCDKETTTQNDIDLGIVNILVGFAPLKPAEFVIIKISQLAGQVEA